MSGENNASEQVLSALRADLDAAKSENASLTRTITSLRSERDAAVKSRDELTAEHDSAVKALQAKLDEAVSASEAAKSDADGKIATLKADADRALAAAEFKAAAIRSGAKNADDLAKLTDLSGVKRNEDGSFAGLEEAVSAAKESRAYLFEEAPKSGAASGTTQGKTKAPTPDDSQFDARSASDNDYAARKAQFLAEK